MLRETMMAAALAVSSMLLPTGITAANATMARIAGPSISSSTVTQIRARGGHVRAAPSHRHYSYRRHGSRGVYLYGVPSLYGYGYSHCAWLYNRAVTTGSRYWWRRYRYECN